MTAYSRAKGMTLCDALEALWKRYGFCFETNSELYMEGLDGARRMAELMNGLREHTPETFGGVPVALVGDYKKGTVTEGGTVRPTGLPTSDVLYYRLDNGDVIVVRPSGTEPKVKFYYLLSGKDEQDARAKCASYQKTLSELAGI